LNSLLTNKKAIAVFILPALILFVIVVYFSIVMTFYYSLLDWDGIGKAAFIGFSNYIKLFVQNKDGFIKSVWNSITL